MKTLLAATLLAIAATATAEPHERTFKVMCGNAAEIRVTLDKYQEQTVLLAETLGAGNPAEEIVYSLWANHSTGTSSWLAQIGDDEYCMIGMGNNIVLPENSPLKELSGQKINYR
jgi:spore coat protein U-like protein